MKNLETREMVLLLAAVVGGVVLGCLVNSSTAAGYDTGYQAGWDNHSAMVFETVVSVPRNDDGNISIIINNTLQSYKDDPVIGKEKDGMGKIVKVRKNDFYILQLWGI